jgi:hypothetical protein
MGKVEESSEERLACVSLCRRDYSVCFWRSDNGGALDISIHLRNRVTQSHQIATRRFGSATGRVTGKFCLVQP